MTVLHTGVKFSYASLPEKKRIVMLMLRTHRCKPRARDPVTHVGDDWTASPGPGASASMALIYWNRGPSAETGPDLTVVRHE